MTDIIPDNVREQISNIPRPVGIKYTVDGEVLVLGVRHPDDPEKLLVRDLPLAVEDAPILPASWTDRCDFVMGVIYEACRQIGEMKDRKVPLSRKELLGFGVQKEDITRLRKMGFVEERAINLFNKDTNKPSACAVVYFTPKGRAYIRKCLAPEYGLEARPSQTTEAETQGEITNVTQDNPT